MVTFTDTTFFSIHSNVLSTAIDDEAILMRGNDNALFGVNSVAAEIWQQLNTKPMNLNMIIDYLVDNFEVEQQVCYQDANALIEQLLKEELIYILD